MKKIFAAAVVLGHLFATAAFAAPTAQLDGGRTAVKLSDDLVGALGSLGVSPGSIAPGILRENAVVQYPVNGGVIDLDTLSGDIFHTGGLSLSAPGTRVALLNFVISTTGDSPVLTGVAAVNGETVDRIPLFDLEPTQGPSIDQWGTLDLRKVNASLTHEAADTLNSVFGVTAFEEGFPVGTAWVQTNILAAEGD